MIRTAIVGTIAVGLALAVQAGPAAAHPQLVAKAKSAGMPAKNCQYCHVAAVPKKETFKPEDLNERGKWLMSEKDKRQAKDVMAEWLKDYPGGKEQK